MEPSIVQENVCVEANVKVAPDVKVSDIQSYFVSGPVIESCPKGANGCSYVVSQTLCVRYVLNISTDVEAVPTGIALEPESEEKPKKQLPQKAEGDGNSTSAFTGRRRQVLKAGEEYLWKRRR